MDNEKEPQFFLNTLYNSLLADFVRLLLLIQIKHVSLGKFVALAYEQDYVKEEEEET